MYKKIEPYKPLKSRCAFPGDEEAPMGYFYNAMGKLGSIQLELDWKMYDFCRLQQITHAHICENEIKIDKFVDENREKLISPSDEDVAAVRIRESINSQSASNYQTYQFSNQMTVVGLWAIAEQTMGFVYKKMFSAINNVNENDVRIPYRFDKFKQKYLELGIRFEGLDTYDDANECRVLNNSIKHGHLIEGQILNFPYFSPMAGKKILEVDFELQRYVTGVIQFLSSLIEQGNCILAPSHPRH